DAAVTARSGPARGANHLRAAVLGGTAPHEAVLRVPALERRLSHRPARLGDERDRDALAVGVGEDAVHEDLAEPEAGVSGRDVDPVNEGALAGEPLELDARDVVG